MTDDWFIAVEGGLARLAICCCRLITGAGQSRVCLSILQFTPLLPRPLGASRCYRRCRCNSLSRLVGLTKEN